MNDAYCSSITVLEREHKFNVICSCALYGNCAMMRLKQANAFGLQWDINGSSQIHRTGIGHSTSHKGCVSRFLTWLLSTMVRRRTQEAWTQIIMLNHHYCCFAGPPVDCIRIDHYAHDCSLGVNRSPANVSCPYNLLIRCRLMIDDSERE